MCGKFYSVIYSCLFISSKNENQLLRRVLKELLPIMSVTKLGMLHAYEGLAMYFGLTEGSTLYVYMSF